MDEALTYLSNGGHVTCRKTMRSSPKELMNVTTLLNLCFTSNASVPLKVVAWCPVFFLAAFFEPSRDLLNCDLELANTRLALLF